MFLFFLFLFCRSVFSKQELLVVRKAMCLVVIVLPSFFLSTAAAFEHFSHLGGAATAWQWYVMMEQPVVSLHEHFF